ncbi:Uncharacterised protein [Vibrio cholerae]|uniref:Uncharacterized protein n=1 Tax=Vibrio cholerae TaxID=666 RepID=A0A656AZB5_VIBCL|nr:Uncharacterised protein [Vibrio cholerae]
MPLYGFHFVRNTVFVPGLKPVAISHSVSWRVSLNSNITTCILGVFLLISLLAICVFLLTKNGWTIYTKQN